MSTLSSLTEAGGNSPLPPGDSAMASRPSRPRKVAPQHPGSVVADALEGIGVSLREAARAMGMSAGGLNKVTLGNGPVTPETALRLAAYLGNTPELWLNLQQKYDLWHERERLKGELAKIKPASERAA